MNKSPRTLGCLLLGMANLCRLILLLALVASLPSARANSMTDTRFHIHGNERGLQNLGRHSAPTNKLMMQAGQSAGSQNRCQTGWMWFNNKCWVTTQSRRNFQNAIELCKKMYDSTLPTIHSEDENEFLRQNIDLQNSPIWLYAKHNHQYNMTKWLDKTPVNFTRWDHGQPSDKSSLVCIKTEDSWYMKKAEATDGQTECVSFWEDAKWGTQVGCLVLLPVVCEKKLAPVSRQPDGPNGTGVSSQYEQQQLSSISGASHSAPLFNMLNLLVTLCVAVGLIGHQQACKYPKSGARY